MTVHGELSPRVKWTKEARIAGFSLNSSKARVRMRLRALMMGVHEHSRVSSMRGSRTRPSLQLAGAGSWSTPAEPSEMLRTASKHTELSEACRNEVLCAPQHRNNHRQERGTTAQHSTNMEGETHKRNTKTKTVDETHNMFETFDWRRWAGINQPRSQLLTVSRALSWLPQHPMNRCEGGQAWPTALWQARRGSREVALENRASVLQTGQAGWLVSSLSRTVTGSTGGASCMSLRLSMTREALSALLVSHSH